MGHVGGDLDGFGGQTMRQESGTPTMYIRFCSIVVPADVMFHISMTVPNLAPHLLPLLRKRLSCQRAPTSRRRSKLQSFGPSPEARGRPLPESEEPLPGFHRSGLGGPEVLPRVESRERWGGGARKERVSGSGPGGLSFIQGPRRSLPHPRSGF